MMKIRIDRGSLHFEYEGEYSELVVGHAYALIDDGKIDELHMSTSLGVGPYLVAGKPCTFEPLSFLDQCDLSRACASHHSDGHSSYYCSLPYGHPGDHCTVGCCTTDGEPIRW